MILNRERNLLGMTIYIYSCTPKNVYNVITDIEPPNIGDFIVREDSTGVLVKWINCICFLHERGIQLV